MLEQWKLEAHSYAERPMSMNDDVPSPFAPKKQVATTTNEPSPTHALMVTNDLLKTAVEMGAEGRENLQFLLQAQRDERAAWAASQYARAMQLLQTEMPRVYKDGENTQNRSRFAKLESVDRHIRPLYTQHGFSMTFTTEPWEREGWMLHIATVSHVDGHEKRFAAPFPVDTHGPKGQPTKTDLHGMGSALSYAQRRLTCMAFGVVTGEDDDGQAATQAPPETITAEQAANLQAMAEEAGVDTARFLKWAKSDSWETIAADKYQRCHDELDGRRKNRFAEIKDNISDDPR